MTPSGPRDLEAARAMLDVSVPDLWLDYFALGGCLGPARIAAFLAGESPVDDYDHDVLTQALNERFLDQGNNHPLPYARQPEAEGD